MQLDYKDISIKHYALSMPGSEILITNFMVLCSYRTEGGSHYGKPHFNLY